MVAGEERIPRKGESCTRCLHLPKAVPGSPHPLGCLHSARRAMASLQEVTVASHCMVLTSCQHPAHASCNVERMPSIVALEVDGCGDEVICCSGQ